MITEDKSRITSKTAKDNLQLRLYSFALWKRDNVISTVKLRGYLKDKDEKDMYFKHTMKDLEETEIYLWKIFDEITRGDFPANSSSMTCSRCEFGKVCPMSFPLPKMKRSERVQL